MNAVVDHDLMSRNAWRVSHLRWQEEGLPGRHSRLIGAVTRG
ncbi:hypothetical protein [Amycolatopsis lexingtonensis]